MIDEIKLPPIPPGERYERTGDITEINTRTIAQMREYAIAAVLAEREACAQVCDEHASCEGIAQQCADAIRARSQP